MLSIAYLSQKDITMTLENRLQVLNSIIIILLEK